MDATLSEMSSSFNGAVWSANGPFLATRVLRQFCSSGGEDKRLPSVSDLVQRSAVWCQGMVVFPRQVFYPVKWKRWKNLFDSSKYV